MMDAPPPPEEVQFKSKKNENGTYRAFSNDGWSADGLISLDMANAVIGRRRIIIGQVKLK